jgi:hypothetical protein
MPSPRSSRSAVPKEGLTVLQVRAPELGWQCSNQAISRLNPFVSGVSYIHSSSRRLSLNLIPCAPHLFTLHHPVTTTIVQRNGTGLSTSSAAAWDEATDFNVTVLWENQALTCVVVVFALAV